MCTVQQETLVPLRPHLHGSEQIFARTKFARFHLCVYAGPAELDTLKNFGTAEGEQVWDLKKEGPKLAHLSLQKFVQFRRSHVNGARWKRFCFCSCKDLFNLDRVNGA